MNFLHTAFSLLIRSNISIPGLAPLIDSGLAADLKIQLGVSPYSESKTPSGSEALTYESPYRDEAGNPALCIWRSPDGLYLRLAYFDGTQFWLERQGKEIWAVWPEASSLEDACSYLLGPVFGILLRIRGVTCLHASAVVLNGRAVAFVGPEGAGKSTTAAAFACEGHAVLSDDVVALNETASEFLVVPAYPHLCLWPESVAMLYGSPDALPPFSKGWEKQRLSLDDRETRFEARTLPLGAIYFLGERRSKEAPSVELVRPQAALLSLVADSFASRTLDREMRAREFEVLGRLVTRVPVRRVFPHDNGSRIHELCQVIREDFASLKESMQALP
ncbi:MAG TPA: serine/threonine protein kinase [Candidatus Angelobacter sp.]|nr:serine/threonine protein kinase [Candidatus Angelobacter sp.]